MQVRIVILPGGKLQIFVDGANVSFAEAEAITQQVLAGLPAVGIAVDSISDVEMHRAGGMDHVHLAPQIRHDGGTR